MLIVAGVGSSRWSATRNLVELRSKTPPLSTVQLRYIRKLISQGWSIEHCPPEITITNPQKRRTQQVDWRLCFDNDHHLYHPTSVPALTDLSISIARISDHAHPSISTYRHLYLQPPILSPPFIKSKPETHRRRGRARRAGRNYGSNSARPCQVKCSDTYLRLR